MICEKASVFADWKRVIEEQCSFYDSCEYPETKKALNFFERVERSEKDAKK